MEGTPAPCVQGRGQVKLQEPGFSPLTLYGTWDQIQVVRLGGKHFSKEPPLALGLGFKQTDILTRAEEQ